MNLDFQNIRLLTEEPTLGPLYRTFRGAFLVGVAALFNGGWSPIGVRTKEPVGWSKTAEWIICQAESGALVVYYLANEDQRKIGEVTVYDGWRELIDRVPVDIIVEAKRKAGVTGETPIPEMPLGV